MRAPPRPSLERVTRRVTSRPTSRHAVRAGRRPHHGCGGRGARVRSARHHRPLPGLAHRCAAWVNVRGLHRAAAVQAVLRMCVRGGCTEPTAQDAPRALRLSCVAACCSGSVVEPRAIGHVCCTANTRLVSAWLLQWPQCLHACLAWGWGC